MKSLPYSETDGVRTFSTEVEDDELEWHVDREDREVIVLQAGGWKLQLDEQIPQPLLNNQKIFIKSLCWHRIIKGAEPLVVKIIKLS